jgi:hypothetical protein
MRKSRMMRCVACVVLVRICLVITAEPANSPSDFSGLLDLIASPDVSKYSRPLQIRVM